MGVDPITMATLAIVAGTGLQAASSVAEGRAARKAAAFDASMREDQAAQRMAQATAEGALAARDKRRFLATQAAQVNALGGQIGSGTALFFADEAARDAELDILNTLAGGANDARSLRADAGRLRWEGRQRAGQANLNAVSSVIDGYSRWTMLQ